MIVCKLTILQAALTAKIGVGQSQVVLKKPHWLWYAQGYVTGYASTRWSLLRQNIQDLVITGMDERACSRSIDWDQ